METLDIFISHSSKDEDIVQKLISLVRSAMNLSAERIRCTSVDGYRLTAGISTDERLRKEIHDSKALVAVITPNSLTSMYVLFELGARWGTGKPLIPLLMSGVSSKQLHEPLSAINALDASNAAQLHQFVEDLGKYLDIQPDRPAVYQVCIEELVEKSTQNANFAEKVHVTDTINVKEHAVRQEDASSSVLKALWQLETEKYSEIGYEIELIATKSGMIVPICKHYLDTLVKDKKLRRLKVLGKNELRYSLTEEGRSFIVENSFFFNSVR